MAKRRTGHQDEVLLIPFLDILCSLIGVLILIIVVLSVAQIRKAGGRTKEDLALSQQLQELQKQKEQQEKSAANLKAKVADLEKRQQDLAAKQQKLLDLRMRLEMSAEEEKKDKYKAAALQKQVEDLIRQIEALAKQTAPLQKEIDELKKQLAARQKKPEQKPQAIVVQPTGSGAAAKGQKIFFVEAAGASIVLHKGGGETQRIARDNVGLDKDYNAFLDGIRTAGNASLIFLVRKDGWSSYSRAAGWAEQEYNLKSGKLPLPGDGPVDLALFDKR